MLARATIIHEEIFTAIILLTVMQFEILHGSAYNIFKGTMAFVQQHIYSTMHATILKRDMRYISGKNKQQLGHFFFVS